MKKLKHIMPRILMFLLIVLVGLLITRKIDNILISGDLQDLLVNERNVKSYTQQDLYSNLKDFSVNDDVITSTSSDPWIFLDTTSVKQFKYIRLDIDLHGVKNNEAQFFYATNEKGFNESDSKRQVLKQGVNHIMIFSPQENTALRFDLTEREGLSLSVRSVELTNKFTPPVKDLLLIIVLNILWCGIWISLMYKFAYVKKIFSCIKKIYKTITNWLNEEVDTNQSPKEDE